MKLLPAPRGVLGVLAFALFTLASPPDARGGPTYTFVDLNASIATSSFAAGVANGQQAGWGRDAEGFDPNHAMLWSGTAASRVDLHPDGFTLSQALGTWGGKQVGFAAAGDVDAPRAILWSGAATNFVDLTPANFRNAQAEAIQGAQQVGRGNPQSEGGGIQHALLWSGTAASAVDLHPAALGFESSYAAGVFNGKQVGAAFSPETFLSHAVLWSGTSDSAVDLHSPTYNTTRASGASDTQQVGEGRLADFSTHALLWSGTADSLLDLHPTGFTQSFARGIAGNVQVGSGLTPEGSAHALAWFGTADSVVDLHTFLSSEYTASDAYGIDADGNIVGEAIGPDGVGHAVMWVPLDAAPIPLPPAALAGLPVLAVICCRKAIRARRARRREPSRLS